MNEMQYRMGNVREISQDVELTRTIQFIISTATRDRHGTVLKPENWELENFNRNGLVGYQHNVYGDDLCNAPNPDDVIGTGRAWVENSQLIGEVKFEPANINPTAEKIFRKVIFGSLKATSVGFLPKGEAKWGEGEESRNGSNPTLYYEKQELLEFSIVNIPSNPDAIRRSMRNQANNAMLYISRTMGGKFTTEQILDMPVRDVIDMMEGKELRNMEGRSKPEMDAEYRQMVESIGIMTKKLDQMTRLRDYWQMKYESAL